MPLLLKRNFFITLIAFIFITVSVFAISRFYLTTKSEVLGQKTSIVRLGLGKLANNIYFYAGIEAGIFAKYGIEFDLKDQPTSLDSINSLIANQIDLSGAISLDNGLNALVSDPKSFQILTVGTEGQGENALNTALITNSNNNISSLKDLENKKIAVQPGPFSITALKYVLNKAGVDISKTEFISITLADQLAALQAGSIDAAFTFEPYVSLAQQKGFKILASGILSKY
jgi:NitT/TauT family transport system substrate-binding protein